LIGIAPTEFAICIGVFFIVFLAYKYVSLSSIAATIAFPTTLFFREQILGEHIPGYKTLIVFSILVAFLLIYAHKENIKRLIAGKENRISFGKKKVTTSQNQTDI
jgi:glycerol-3-phosphate acyltransferase PlsY